MSGATLATATPRTGAASPQGRGLARRLTPPIAVALGVRIALLRYDRVPSVDEAAYLTIGRNLWAGRGLLGVQGPEVHFPPLVPLVLGAVARLLGDEHAAALAVSTVSGTLLLVPVALLARRIAGDTAGIAAAWIAALAPGLTWHLTILGGGSESPYALLLLSAVACAARAREARRPAAAALASGTACAMAYLARPEALQAGAVLACFVAVRLLTAPGARAAAVRRTAAAAAAFAVPVALAAVPYAAYQHERTGSWQLTGKAVDVSLDAWRAVAEGDRERRERDLYAVDHRTLRLTAVPRPLTALVREDPRGYAALVGVNARRLAQAYVEPSRPWTWDLLPAPVLALALYGAWRRRRDPATLLVGATAAMVLTTPLLFFVNPRYATPATALLCVLAGCGVRGAVRPARLAVGAAACALCALSVLGGAAGPRWDFSSPERVEQRTAGEWLRDNVASGATVLCRNQVVGYYARRTLVMPPHAPLDTILAYGRANGASHLVADPNTLLLRPSMRPLHGPGPWDGLDLVYEDAARGRLTRVFRVAGGGS